MICGGIGGVSLWVAIFPSDVIKSRVQVQSSKAAKNPSFVRMLVLVGRNEGKFFFYCHNKLKVLLVYFFKYMNDHKIVLKLNS